MQSTAKLQSSVFRSIRQISHRTIAKSSNFSFFTPFFMAQEHTIKTEGLTGAGYDFAVLHNALLEAGYTHSTALEISAQIHSQGIKVECKCK